MRRFVNEALGEVALLEEHVTTWMAEEPDPREGDADKLTARQRVLVHAGYIKGALEAGLAASDVDDPSAYLTAAVAHVREPEGQLLRDLATAAPAADSDAAAYRRGLTDAAWIVKALPDRGKGYADGLSDAEDAIRRAGGGE